MDTVKSTVWSNPRYLITSADTPVILHVRERSFICVGCFVEFRQCCFAEIGGGGRCCVVDVNLLAESEAGCDCECDTYLHLCYVTDCYSVCG